MKIAFSGSAGQYVNVETGEPVGDGEHLDIGTTWWGCGQAHPVSEDTEHCGVSGCHGVAVPKPSADVVLRLTTDELAALARGETIHRQVESEIGHPDAMGVVTVELTGEA